MLEVVIEVGGEYRLQHDGTVKILAKLNNPIISKYYWVGVVTHDNGEQVCKQWAEDGTTWDRYSKYPRNKIVERIDK